MTRNKNSELIIPMKKILRFGITALGLAFALSASSAADGGNVVWQQKKDPPGTAPAEGGPGMPGPKMDRRPAPRH